MDVNRLLPITGSLLVVASFWLASPWAKDTQVNLLLRWVVLISTTLAFAVAGHRAGTRKRYLTNGGFVLLVLTAWLAGPAAWSLLLDGALDGLETLERAEVWVIVVGNTAIFALAMYFGRRLRKAAVAAVRDAIKQATDNQKPH